MITSHVELLSYFVWANENRDTWEFTWEVWEATLLSHYHQRNVHGDPASGNRCVIDNGADIMDDSHHGWFVAGKTTKLTRWRGHEATYIAQLEDDFFFVCLIWIINVYCSKVVPLVWTWLSLCKDMTMLGNWSRLRAGFYFPTPGGMKLRLTLLIGWIILWFELSGHTETRWVSPGQRLGVGHSPWLWR